jgi:hypothetical protein
MRCSQIAAVTEGISHRTAVRESGLYLVVVTYIRTFAGVYSICIKFMYMICASTCFIKVDICKFYDGTVILTELVRLKKLLLLNHSVALN